MRKNSVELHYKSSHKLEPCQRQLWGEQLDQGSSLLFLMCSGYRATSHHTPAIPIFFFFFFKPCGVASILWRVWFLPIWSECVPLTFLHCFHWLEQIQQGRKRGLKRQATVFLCYRAELYILTEQYSAFMPCVMKPSVIRQVQGLWPTPCQVIF